MTRPRLFAFYWACLLIFLNLRMDYILSFLGCFFFEKISLPMLSFLFPSISLQHFYIALSLNKAKSFQILHFSTNKFYGLPLVPFIHSWIMVKSLFQIYTWREGCYKQHLSQFSVSFKDMPSWAKYHCGAIYPTKKISTLF